MHFNLKGRHFLTLSDYTSIEIQHLLDLAAHLKLQKATGIRSRQLEGKNIALIFEKPSTRTRCAFTVACIDEGAHPEYLGKDDLQLGKKESIADTARVLGRMFDGIQFRGFKHATIEELARYAGVPVWNGLTDKHHPTQILADFLTIQEHLGHLREVKLAYVGNGLNNVTNSLMIGAAKMGMDFRLAAPTLLFPEAALITHAQQIALENNARVLITENIADAVAGADVLYTDVWFSMGEEEHIAERITLLHPYQVNHQMLQLTGKPDSVLFLHCLPAFHNTQTDIGQHVFEKFGLEAMEVTDEVFESPNSKVFDEAENRMHTIKAILNATLS